MLSKLLIALSLMALCVAIHASGVTSALRWVRRGAYSPQQFWRWTWFFVCVAGWMILLHLAEISVWAFYYFWRNAISDRSRPSISAL
jgi:hypothetical protein